MKRNVNIFDKIGSLIPGYTGYSERDSRRNCDKKLRIELSTELIGFTKKIDKHISTLIKKKNFEDMFEMEDIRKKFNTLSDQINYSPYGVSPFFSDNKIKDTELEEIYILDLALASSIERLKQINNFDDIQPIHTSFIEINQALNNRNNYIKSFN